MKDNDRKEKEKYFIKIFIKEKDILLFTRYLLKIDLFLLSGRYSYINYYFIIKLRIQIPHSEKFLEKGMIKEKHRERPLKSNRDISK